MADTPQRRVLPARDRRDSAAKRRASESLPIAPPIQKKTTPPKATAEVRQKRKYTRRVQTISQTPSRRTSTPLVDEALPTKVTDAKPLPTSVHKQPANLSIGEYQSIAESAILSASLHRSRARWLCDGIFERYWTKPSKKKGAEVTANNPDPKSMHKLGTCTVTIEPHIFDAVFYTVKEMSSYAKHPNQYSKPPPTPANYGTVLAPPSGPPGINPSLGTPATAPKDGVKQEVADTPPPGAPRSTAEIKLRGGVPGPAPGPSTPQTPKPDPVIHMLASRAASDPQLKNLMQVVASSKATPSQLKEFQSHIDDLNTILKAKKADAGRQTQEKARASTSSAQKAASKGENGENSKNSTPASSGSLAPIFVAQPVSYSGLPPGAMHGSDAPPMPTGPIAYPPPNAYMSPRAEPMIKHILLEFVTPLSLSQPSNTDRYIFPKFAVLDWPSPPLHGPPLEMVASFFVERSGADILASMADAKGEDAMIETSKSKWKNDVQYYEPVTMTLRTKDHRVLKTIAQNARNLPDVLEYMGQVMKTKTRAPKEYLVFRLPVPGREMVAGGADDDGDLAMADALINGGGVAEESAVETAVDDEDAVEDELKDHYGN